MPRQPAETARYFRSAALPGVEALHATFVTHRYAPHVHETWTLAHVVSGAAKFRLTHQLHIAPAGSVFLIPPDAVHTGEPAHPGGYSYRVLYLPPDLLNASAPRPGRDRTRGLPVVLQAGALARSLTRVHSVLTRRSPALEQGEALSALLDTLPALVGCGAPRPNRRPEHAAVTAAREYITDHWSEDFTLEELARCVGLSRFHLLRRFRDDVGVPPSTYRRGLRIQAAQRMLQAGASPAMTALDCGFYDQSHLNRHFKQVTGVTPALYAAARP